MMEEQHKLGGETRTWEPQKTWVMKATDDVIKRLQGLVDGVTTGVPECWEDLGGGSSRHKCRRTATGTSTLAGLACCSI